MGSLNRPIVLGFGSATVRSPARGGEGYPPFDIERFPPSSGKGAILVITLAVAGFRADDLEVEVANNQLVIRGRQADEPARTYLHRGIAARRFQRSFVLKDGVEVINARLRNGLLSIELSEPLEAGTARTIAIDTPG